MRATLCSRNAHKARELEALLPGWSIETLDADDYPPETGDTYYDNARMKAAFGRARVPGWTIGADSGLEVAALHGRPRVHSARYAPQAGPAIATLPGLLGGPPVQLRTENDDVRHQIEPEQQDHRPAEHPKDRIHVGEPHEDRHDLEGRLEHDRRHHRAGQHVAQSHGCVRQHPVDGQHE